MSVILLKSISTEYRFSQLGVMPTSLPSFPFWCDTEQAQVFFYKQDFQADGELSVHPETSLVQVKHIQVLQTLFYPLPT